MIVILHHHENGIELLTLFHLFLYPSSYSRMVEKLIVDQVALYLFGLDEMDRLVTTGGCGAPVKFLSYTLDNLNCISSKKCLLA